MGGEKEEDGEGNYKQQAINSLFIEHQAQGTHDEQEQSRVSPECLVNPLSNKNSIDVIIG